MEESLLPFFSRSAIVLVLRASTAGVGQALCTGYEPRAADALRARRSEARRRGSSGRELCASMTELLYGRKKTDK